MPSPFKFDNALKPLHSAGIMGLGKGVQGILSFAFLALAARALGAENFGFLVLIHGLVYGFSHILRAQTWQAVVKFGADALKTDDTNRFQRLLRYTTALDILAALIGFAVLQGLISIGGGWFDMTPEIETAARLYTIAIIFMILSTTPFGVLRLLDRFDLLAVQTLVAPIIRFIGALYLFFSGGTLTAFFVLWFVAAILSRLALFLFALRELRIKNLLNGALGANDKKATPEKDLLKFILAHNLSQGLLQAQAHFGLYIVGALLGPAAAGIYKVAEKFADILVKPATKFLVPAIYPELAKLNAKEDGAARRKMIVKNSAFIGALALVIFLLLIIFGKSLIATLIGIEFTAAYIPMLWLCAGGVIGTSAFALDPLLSASGRIKRMVMSYIAAVSFYCAAMVLLVPIYGLTGAGIALCAASCITALLLFLSVKDLIKR